MNSGPVRKLLIDSLSDNIDVISDCALGFYKENCMVCFDNQGHNNGVCLVVYHLNSRHEFAVCWTGELTEQLRLSYADLKRATDNAACAIALLLIRELTDFKAVEQACIGTTVDYFLGPKENAPDDPLIFNHKARLEASGILKENRKNTVESRIRSKVKRLNPGLPTIIVIVEFSKPWSKIDQYE